MQESLDIVTIEPRAGPQATLESLNIIRPILVEPIDTALEFQFFPQAM